jgi:hypothetical protein
MKQPIEAYKEKPVRKTNINAFYLKALEERKWVDSKWRAFQNMMTVLDKRDHAHLREELLKIEQYFIKEKEAIN